VSISNSEFDGNRSNGDGGAIVAASVTATGSTFARNSANNGGAMSANTVSVTASTFIDNHANVYGGAINARTGTFTRSRFTRNTAGTHGGAVIFWHAEKADLQKLRRNSFIGNRAGAGGAITLASCGRVYRQSQLARIAAANQFSMNRATVQRRTTDIETGFCD